MRLCDVLFLSLVFLGGVACAEEFSDDQWNELKGLESELAWRAPPAKSHHVYMGRALAPLAAFTALKGDTTQSEVPLTQFLHDLPPQPGEPRRRYTSIATRDFRPLSDAEREKLFVHFDRILPSDAQLGVKELVVLDYVRTGRSLFAVARYLDLYRKERKRKFTLKVIAIESRLSRFDAPVGSTMVFDATIAMGSFPKLNLEMESKSFRSISSVGEWTPTGAVPAGPVPNENPQPGNAFRASLAERMRGEGIPIRCPALWKSIKS